MKRIVIFDMDGTLINSALDITISINYVRAQGYALSALSEQFVIDAINAHERNLAHLFYETETYEERAKILFEEHYKNQCIQNVYSYNEIVETLSHLSSRGCIMSVATNAPSAFAILMLTHLGIAEYFNCILGADNVDHPKPHPQMIERILMHHSYNEENDRAWMIGDNSKDMQAAKSAKINTIFAAWGFSDKGEGDFIAYHPRDVKSIILEE
ncbi:MAG: HAD family hydrolase [Sulfurimonas sp.]|jgi:phosphoglycolate phosphatase